MNHTFDAIDIKIITLLQQNARMSIKEIAQQVFLSSPAVSSRIERLEQAGVIRGYHAQMDPMLLGYHIRAFIQLNIDPVQKEEFYSLIQSIPNVIECNCITGKYAILLEVSYPSTEELDGFINKLQCFGQTKTHMVFSTSVEHRELPVISG